MKKLCYTLFFLSLQTALMAQSPYVILERVVSIRLTNTLLKEALTQVAQRGRFEFSYNAHIFDLTKKISLISNGLTVREVLFQMVGDKYAYHQKGDYLVIKKIDKSKQFISGYISDARTGKRVSNATVYDKKTLRSTTTDENGYYNLQVTPQRSTVVVAQLNYKDTVLQITEGTSRFVKLDLDIKTQPKIDGKIINWDKIPSKLADVFISPLHEINSLNVQDSIHRHFQLSLLPYIGTNHTMSGNVINVVSINALVGYSRGNSGVELSGLGNFTRENITGFQAAGVFNIVKGTVTGVQAAGLFNHIGDTLTGVQLAGFSNYTKHTQAINQSAGFANVARNGVLKTQFAGFANVADTINGGQASGFFNHAKDLNGVQAAGFMNTAKTVNGVQVAGFLNTAKTVNGTQVAGFLNMAKTVKGIQIGVFNYADTAKGLQIGLVNYARIGGYYALELSTNEITNVNLAYKSGHRLFYTTLIAGISPRPQGTVWSHGVGIGTLLKANNWIDVNIEATHRHINVDSYTFNRQEWVQLGLYGNIHWGNRFEIVAGPNYNAFFANKSDSQYTENQGKIFPSFIQRKQYGNGNAVADTWLGGCVALRVRLNKEIVR